MLKTIPRLALLASFAAAFLVACSPTSSPPKVDQALLDSATNPISATSTDITGDPFSAFSDNTATTKIRDLVSNIKEGEPIVPGTIFVRRAYKYDEATKKRGEPINFVVMIKREAGYFPEGDDYEYINIPHKEGNDYTKNPNGVLADRKAASGNGDEIKGCTTCHATSATGADRLFSR